jgi:hypothetical protein
MELGKQINSLVQKFSGEDLKTLEEMLNQCGQYIEKVNNMGNVTAVAKYYAESDEYRELFSNIDKTRSSVHDGLIVSVKLVNKLCQLYNLEPIFNGDTEDRITVAEFAMEVVLENFENRKR